MSMKVVRLTDTQAKTVTVRSTSSRGIFDSADNMVGRVLQDLAKAVAAFNPVWTGIEHNDHQLDKIIRDLARGGSVTLDDGRFELSSD